MNIDDVCQDFVYERVIFYACGLVLEVNLIILNVPP